MSIDTSFTLQPTDTETNVTAQTPDAPQSAEPVTPAPKPARSVQHTDGGLPAIPLLIITSNTTAAGLSAAAVVGGPLTAAGAAAAGIVTVAAVSANARRKAQKAARRATPKPAPKKAPHRQNVPPRTPHGGGTRTHSNRSGSTRSGAGPHSLGGGRSNTGRPTNASAGKKTNGPSLSKATPFPPKITSPRKPTTGSTSPNGATGKRNAANGPSATTLKSQLKQIKDLRNARKAEGKTRKEQREQDTKNRRARKDGRRGERRALKNLKKQERASRNVTPGAAKHGKAGVTASLAKAAREKTDAARTKARDHKDQQTRTRAQRIRQARRNATARAALTRKVLASKARYAAKAAGAALLAAPVGLLGCLTTPLGRKLGWSWLMYPGRRLYRALTANAKHNHLARIADAKNTHAHTTDSDALETDQPIAASVPRGPRRRTTPQGAPAMTDALKFLFEESAADMEAAASAYEPGGMIHVYQTIQGMPAGIQSWANTFKILAEKSDESFPLDSSVGEALGDVFALLQKAASAAEEVQETFEKKHAHDLERLLDPRISLEAEKTWDAAANEDFL
ncbi:hypothetical protein [Streptomyces sp. NPDC018055]|uniref:hypothetical protein n=1 Tax=Streptomyces sp. NPDC018055 TaxID=3365038 RepID=UPI00379A3D67